jgi:hypothetical protein
LAFCGNGKDTTTTTGVRTKSGKTEHQAMLGIALELLT